MSFAALNHPSLVAVLGAGAYAVLPSVEKAFVDGTLSLTGVKVANVVAYFCSVVATALPGRIDGADQRIGKDEDNEMIKLSTGKKGRTLVAPSGWAFAIWGPIFVGEFLFVVSSLFLPESDPCVTIFKKASGPFVMAQFFQVLWTASFRPKYNNKRMFISVAALAGIAFSLSRAHSHFAASPKEYNGYQYLLYFLPLSMHFGWTSAASLVNLNGAVALQEDVSPKVVAWLGHSSVIAAAALSALVSLTRSAPVYAGVITWALLAVADGMAKRVNDTLKEEDQDRVGIYGAKLQRKLALLGVFVSGIASIMAAVALRK